MLAEPRTRAITAVASVLSDENKAAALLAMDTGEPAPDNWQEWCPALFPRTFTAPFADRHIQLWEWIESMAAGQRPSPAAYIDVEPRGGGKTTTIETAVVRVAAKKTREFVLYVRETQDKANKTVQNIATKMESATVARYYPSLANRKLSKYGHSRGWRVDLLRTDSDFNVAGLGLDAAARGVKLDDSRPDWIIFDDIDDEQDTIKAIAKKVNIITKSILPTGAPHCAYAVVQNLIHANSIVNTLVEGTADFLFDSIISGPHVAVENLAYEQTEQRDRHGRKLYKITAGEPTWEGQNIVTCEAQINDWGLSSFLRESQHEVEDTGGLWDHIEFEHIRFDELPDLIVGEVWVDPAVTATDDSDCQGITAGGLSEAGIIYDVFSWEGIDTPLNAIKRAILKAVELKFTRVGIESDQGGDTWKSVYYQAWKALVDDENHPHITTETKRPIFRSAKAGAGHGSKIHRNQQMLADYENGRVVHVLGTHNAGERALKRFPNKPLDLADAKYWQWYHLNRARRGTRIL